MAEADFTSILSSKPKLKTLNKYHDLHKKWYILGAELELDDEELSKVEDEYSDDSMRTLKMFGLWLKKGENPTYSTLPARHWWTLIRKTLPNRYAQT